MSAKKVLSKGRRYTVQQREQAVRLVQLAREEGRGYAAVQRIAVQLGVWRRVGSPVGEAG